MTRLKISNLIFVAVFCFFSFLVGWISGLYVDKSRREQQGQGPKAFISSPPIDFKGKKITEPDKGGYKASKLMDTKSSFNQKQQDQQEREQEKQGGRSKTPFFEEMKSNILALFDPYQMDFLVRKQTHLGEKDSPYRKKPSIQARPTEGDKTPPLVASPNSATSKNKNLSANQASSAEAVRDNSLGQKPSKPNPLSSPSPFPLSPPKTRKELREIEKLKKIQAEDSKKNLDQLMQIAGRQKFFSIDGKFSFLINGFSEKEKALKYVREIKSRHPLWSVLIKTRKDHFRVYIGPFLSKEKAEEFKNMFPATDFSLDFLQEVSL